MNWASCLEALVSIIENPSAERGYERLRSFYEKTGMPDQMDALEFLIGNKFHADDSGIGKE